MEGFSLVEKYVNELEENLELFTLSIEKKIYIFLVFLCYARLLQLHQRDRVSTPASEASIDKKPEPLC